MRAVGWALLAAVAACAYERPALAIPADGGGADGPADGALDGASACAGDDQCASGVCAAGACASAATVSYVAIAGDDRRACTRAEPCATIARALARQAELAVDVRRVVVEPGSYGPQRIELAATAVVVGRRAEGGVRPRIRAQASSLAIQDGGDLELRALVVAVDAADLGAAGPLPVVLRCDGAASRPGRLTLRDVDVGAQPGTDDLVQLNACDGVIERTTLHDAGGFGVKATAGALTVRSSQIRGCTDGGIQTVRASAVTITGSIVAGNGAPLAGLGGVALDVTGALVFTGNTVAANASSNDSTRALSCLDQARQIALPNNLVTETQFKTSCRLTHSVVAGTNRSDTDATNVLAGGIDEVRYVDAARGDYHIEPTSPAVGAGVVIAGVDPGLDIDSEARPQGGLDVGADELP